MPTRIDKLTSEQEALMSVHAEEWIAKGLQTGETDWDTFDKYMPICYQKAGLQYPTGVVRVQSPLIGALAASLAEGILRKKGRKNGAVGDAVDDAVRDADSMTKLATQYFIGLKNKLKINTQWHYWLGGQFWVGYGWGWHGVAYVDFLINKCGLQLSQDMMERAEANRKVSESVNYIWANRNFIMVCARPKSIHRNQQGALHNTRGMSIEYPDGYGLYHLNGVRFDEALFERVTSRKMTLEEVLKIEDIDQRKQAMRFVNVWDFIKEAKGVELDTYTKVGAKDGRKIRYWLYEFPASADLFPKGAKYMVYDDSMVGAAEQHMQGVLMEHKTVAEAMAWKQSDDLYTVTPAEWEALQLDVHFT